MKGWLRASAVLTAIFMVGHSFGTFSEPEGAQVPVAAMMRAVHFDMGGAQRTYWDMFKGYGILIIVTAALFVALYWMLASLAPDDGRPLALALALAQIAFAVIAFADFFWAPGVLNGLSAACAIAFAVTARRQTAT